MPIQTDSGRKDTGRTDKYSNESPKKDYQDYKTDYPKAEETARKISKDITDNKLKPQHVGTKSLEVRKQNLFLIFRISRKPFQTQRKRNGFIKKMNL